MRTFGVEEELLLVSVQTGEPVPVAEEMLRETQRSSSPLQRELQQEMIEAVTAPCFTAAQLADEVLQARRAADAAAARHGARALPLATSPTSTTPHPSLRPRYLEMLVRYGSTARSALACGLHVHVGIADAAEGVAVLDRIRVWLPVLLALSANSPFADGVDTGYASHRSQTLAQWPSAGPTDAFGTAAAYAAFEDDLLRTGTLMDAGMLYLDARLSRSYPTIEVRVADVCLRAEDTAVLAALVRALVDTAAEQWRRGEEAPGCSVAVLRLATWRARRSGIDEQLVHPRTGQPADAVHVVDALLAEVLPALEANGDGELVVDGVHRILFRGSGAHWQRRVARHSGIEDVALQLCRELAAGRIR
ncbi:glutamate--cysteine ligase [Rathayibacter sp. VKM Ac-2856]|nr:glutamate--cysteine ligase [Rathayibacter sp. VKM Ac-2858]NQX18507.1 glutamate--cysteine ligase [Rathayibacter sp. VKM Ac-2856]